MTQDEKFLDADDDFYDFIEDLEEDEQAESEGDSEVEEEEDIIWEDYCDFPFAMEIVNGEIISLTPDFQKVIRDKFLSKYSLKEDALAYYLSSDDDGEDDIPDEVISDYDKDFLAEVFGFSFEDESFSNTGIGFLESNYGSETKELIERLGYVCEENINYAPHHHGDDGVIYVEHYE